MSYELNVILSGLILLGVILFFFLQFKKQLREEVSIQLEHKREHLEIPYLVEEIKDMLFRMTTRHFDNSFTSKESYARELTKRVELKKALKGCNNGSYEDKAYIIDYISDLLMQYLVKKDELNHVIFFDRPRFLSPKDKFDILLYDYYKRYQEKGLTHLMEDEGWQELQLLQDEQLPVYEITKEQVEKAYFDHQPHLEDRDKYLIIAQRIYEIYKGFGVIDKIRDMSIDGISGGVSGVIDMTAFDNLQEGQDFGKYPHNYDSVWIFFKGRSIHLSFLSFGNEQELKRVCQGIYRYNKAGQLSEGIGYKVNEMKDGSRVVVVRPPFSESWAFFVRKFHLKNIELEDLIQDENKEVAIDLLSYLMKGQRITAITGSQGSGKTTLLMALIRHINPTLTLRVQEMSFELHLRKLYPKRNILTFKETESVSGQAGLDLQKKTDGAVNILGEIATDEISVLMLQMAQVASLFTLFTHHGKTVNDLVLSLRNSLLKCNVFRDEGIAEEQVVKVLNFDIHLNKNIEGKRYIERITEIIPIENRTSLSREYQNAEDKLGKFMDTMTDYFEKRIAKKRYEDRVIIYFDQDAYQIGHPISQHTVEDMIRLMSQEDQRSFITYLEHVWGDHYAHIYQYC
jgi:pilus assembly protein CpaF